MNSGPTEYEVRVQALTLASQEQDTTYEVLKRAKEFAAYLREGVEADQSAADAELRNKPLTMGICDGCINGVHPHTFRPCPKRGFQCSVWDEQ